MTKRIPIQARSLEKYERIIRTARRILEREDFAKSTTASIAEAAGVGVATVYEYFDNKEDILMALLDREIQELWRRSQEKVPTWMQMAPDGALRDLLNFAVDESLQRASLVHALIDNLPGLLNAAPAQRIVSQFEVMIQLVFVRQDRIGSGRNANAAAFAIIHAVGGILLGIARGLPVGVKHEDLTEELILIATKFLDRN